MDEQGIVIKNKERLVAQGYRQEEGIDYNETFAHVARLEAIRIFLAYAAYMDKALYRLKQAPRAWYETLSKFLTQHKFVRVYAGCNLATKRTSGGCQILGGKLVCWSAKKQNSVAMSSAEVEYVAAAGCCAQVLWIKSQLADYDVLYDKVPIFCDNTSAIAISNNPVLHSRTKHIDIRYHCIKDHILKGDIELYFVPIDLQLADIFTKPLAEPSFTRLVAELDGHIAFNNSVALLDSKIPEFKDMLQFLSECCISKALVIQPSAVYNKYLRDLWYSTKVVDNTINFSLSHFEKSLSFDRDILASAIGLEYSKEYVSLPDHEAVNDAITTLGGNQGSHDQLNINQQMIAFALCWGLKIDIAGVLYHDLISNLTAGGKKGREKNICYTRYLSLVMEHLMGKDYVNNYLTPTKSFQITSATFKKPTSSEVPLTSHMHKVAKLDEEPQVTPSEGTNIESSGAKSLSETSKHLDSTTKAKPDKKQRKKKTSSSSEPIASKDVSQSLILQTSESQHADETEITTDTTQSLDASMSAEEQENQPQTADTEKEQDNVVTEDVNMVDDGTEFDIADENLFDTESEIQFVKSYKPVTDNEESLFTSKESDNEEDSELASIPDDEIGSEESLSEPKISKSEEKDGDNVLEELADLRALADKPSKSISHIKEEIISLSTKIGQMESNITKKVSEELHSSIPVLITEALKQELTGLLTDALKSTLPALLKDFIKESMDTCVEEKLPIFNEEVQKSFKAQIPELFIQLMNKELIAFNKLEANRFMTKLVFLLHSAKVLKKTNAEGEKSDHTKGTNTEEPEQANRKRLQLDPSKDERNGKGIATEEEPLKQLVPFLKQSGSDPKALNLYQFSESGKKMTLEEAYEQMMYLKRLVDQKAAEEKTKRSLHKINIEAQKAQLA
ncbi:retrovirus-related pol polyprotein from transposon TNT 1-94 [Tanacetum coccineum]|uniref:Retrovirus-related pol polyprotein from transposon TNT 1-94 n=1 Tax=Tanacetum coccineum TaxID=301880 RepID=A0ABQ4YZ87_9ASTR